jgi:predicted molibdopterin-dependent oxidoreductase YjgC
LVSVRSDFKNSSSKDLNIGQAAMRIEEHPILGQFEKGAKIKFTFDGQPLEGFEGEPIAIALRSNDVVIHRYTTRRNEPRGVFCAIGRCTDCIMVVNGRPNIRTCVEPLKSGMIVETQKGRGPEK